MKRFNYTGTCIPNRHYMVTITEKLDKIKNILIMESILQSTDQGNMAKRQLYFCLNKN